MYSHAQYQRKRKRGRGHKESTTAGLAATAGANVFVAGSSVFGNSKGITVAIVDRRDSIAETTRA